MPEADDVVIIGHIGGPYGVKGWVHVASYTVPLENLMAYRPWRLRPADSGCWRDMDCARVNAHGDGFVAQFAEVADRDSARALKGWQIGIDADRLPAVAADEFYWRDLIGQTVIDQHGRELGRVERLIETGARDVLVIRGEEEVLIPFADPFVTEVDLERQVIRVDWDE